LSSGPAGDNLGVIRQLQADLKVGLYLQKGQRRS
jgi:hypothetical protein